MIVQIEKLGTTNLGKYFCLPNWKYWAKTNKACIMIGRGKTTVKKHSSQPLGGEAKDSRTEDCRADMESWCKSRQEEEKILTTSNRYIFLAQVRSYPDRTMWSSSFSSRGSRRGGKCEKRDAGNRAKPCWEHETKGFERGNPELASHFVTPTPVRTSLQSNSNN